MKKLLILLLVLMTAVFSANADESPKKTYGTGDTLTIKAYKKDKAVGQTYTLKVVDALTGSLDDITKYADGNREINIDDYVNKFLGSVNDEVGLSRKAIFSIHVGGNITSSFKVSVKFEDFARYTLNDKTWTKTKNESEVIKVKYFMRDMNYFFTSTGTTTATDSTNKTETISSSSSDATVTVDSLGGYGILEFIWTVSSKNTGRTSTENYWDVETMFAMIIDSSTYEAKANGTYRAPITITLTYES